MEGGWRGTGVGFRFRSDENVLECTAVMAGLPHECTKNHGTVLLQRENFVLVNKPNKAATGKDVYSFKVKVATEYKSAVSAYIVTVVICRGARDILQTVALAD